MTTYPDSYNNTVLTPLVRFNNEDEHEGGGFFSRRWFTRPTSRINEYYERLECYFNKRFHICERGSSMKQEVQGGIVLFSTSAYIFILNPRVLSISGLNSTWSFYATILTASFGTGIVGWFYNLPLVISPAMGLNTLMAVELASSRQIPIGQVLGASFISSFILLILCRSGQMLKLVNMTPDCLKKSIVVSIGLFQAVIGLTNLGLIAPSDCGGGISTVGPNLLSLESLVAIITVITVVILMDLQVEGAILWGIVLGSIVAKCLGMTMNIHESNNNIDNSELFMSHPTLPYYNNGIGWLQFLLSTTTILLVTFIDTGGVLIGITANAKELANDDGTVINGNGAVTAVAVTGMLSSLIGCSPPVIFIESYAALSFGARTGLASITSLILFMLCLMGREFSSLVPTPVGHSILVLVGSLMMGATKGISWNKTSEAFPAYVMILSTIFTCSLFNGAACGFILYGLLQIPNMIFGTTPSLDSLLSSKELSGEVVQLDEYTEVTAIPRVEDDLHHYVSDPIVESSDERLNNDIATQPTTNNTTKITTTTTTTRREITIDGANDVHSSDVCSHNSLMSDTVRRWSYTRLSDNGAVR